MAQPKHKHYVVVHRRMGRERLVRVGGETCEGGRERLVSVKHTVLVPLSGINVSPFIHQPAGLVDNLIEHFRSVCMDVMSCTLHIVHVNV